jgi:hypothetical protein
MLSSAVSQTGVAASIAPEDLQRGDCVAILSVIHEYPSFLWCSDSALECRNEPVQVSYKCADGGIPLKIKAVCLPFVFAKDPAGNYRNLDTRLCRLVRLSPGYVKKVWKTLRRKRGDQGGAVA